jgi:hypothetical protein
MARLVSYKVKDESTYSTFDNKNSSNAQEKIQEISENESADSGKNWFCCNCWKLCGSQETVSDDIEFAMVKYAQVWTRSWNLSDFHPLSTVKVSLLSNCTGTA